MSVRKKIFWGGLGWVLGGPIGAIIGYSLAGMNEQSNFSNEFIGSRNYPKTQPGDFIVSLLVLFGAVMKADEKMLKSELDFIKAFLSKQFSKRQVNDFMVLFKDILKQSYPIKDVCRQISRSMDHPSRLELIHILYGLSAADGDVHEKEVQVIQAIANYLNINKSDYESIKATFAKDKGAPYRILEIDESANEEEVKKAFRKMANKYHPDKVSHLGKEMQDLAEEKFKAVNDAYQQIKEQQKSS